MEFTVSGTNVYGFIKVVKAAADFGKNVILHAEQQRVVLASCSENSTGTLLIVFPINFFSQYTINNQDRTVRSRGEPFVADFSLSSNIVFNQPGTISIELTSMTLKHVLTKPQYVESCQWRLQGGPIAIVGRKNRDLLITKYNLRNGLTKTNRITYAVVRTQLPTFNLSYRYQMQIRSKILSSALQPFKKDVNRTRVKLWTETDKHRRIVIETDYRPEDFQDPDLKITCTKVIIPHNNFLLHTLIDWVYLKFEMPEYKIFISLIKNLSINKNDSIEDPGVLINTAFGANSTDVADPKHLRITAQHDEYPIQASCYLRADAVVQQPRLNLEATISLLPRTSTATSDTPSTPQHSRSWENMRDPWRVTSSNIDNIETPFSYNTGYNSIPTPHTASNTPQFTREGTLVLETDNSCATFLDSDDEYTPPSTPSKRRRVENTYFVESTLDDNDEDNDEEENFDYQALDPKMNEDTPGARKAIPIRKRLFI
ncbi:hypothetical protein G9A89_002864 [Geosiphon pyriformis]|nr:hypothetical protein G9A89_002864 [Geosiphon pyriformis]